MAHRMTIEYGDEILLGLGLSPSEFALEARFLLAANLYALGRITSGQAAAFSGVLEIPHKKRGASEYGISVLVSTKDADDGQDYEIGRETKKGNPGRYSPPRVYQVWTG